MEEIWELEPYAGDDKETLAFLEADLVDAAGKTGFHPSWSTFLRYCVVSKINLCLKLCYHKY